MFYDTAQLAFGELRHLQGGITTQYSGDSAIVHTFMITWFSDTFVLGVWDIRVLGF